MFAMEIPWKENPKLFVLLLDIIAKPSKTLPRSFHRGLLLLHKKPRMIGASYESITR